MSGGDALERARWRAAGVTVISAVVVACGVATSRADGGRATERALTPPQYPAPAAGICVNSYTAIARIAPAHTAAALARFMPRAVALGRQEIKELAALDAPAELASQHERVVAIIRREVGLLAAQVVLVRHGKNAV